MRLSMISLGFLLVLGTSACANSTVPSREQVAAWERQDELMCQAFWESGRAVDVPADLAERIVAGLRPEVPAWWGNRLLSHQPDELLPTAGAYVGRGPSPEDVWMIRLDTDTYIAILGFTVTDIDDQEYGRQAFVIVKGPLNRPEEISWPPFLNRGELVTSNPTLFETKAPVFDAESPLFEHAGPPPDWQVPPEFACSRS